jgi:hypothetical protein
VGTREFALYDLDRNALTFFRETENNGSYSDSIWRFAAVYNPRAYSVFGAGEGNCVCAGLRVWSADGARNKPGTTQTAASV